MRDEPRFLNVRTGGNLPARPGLLRAFLGGLAFAAFWWGVFVAMGVQ